MGGRGLLWRLCSCFTSSQHFQLFWTPPLSFVKNFSTFHQVCSLCIWSRISLNIYFLDFNWKRCVFRSFSVLCLLFIAETVPSFSSILDLVGASTVTLLTFVFPPLFYMRLADASIGRKEWVQRWVYLYWDLNSDSALTGGCQSGKGSTAGSSSWLASLVVCAPPSLPVWTSFSAASKFRVTLWMKLIISQCL